MATDPLPLIKAEWLKSPVPLASALQQLLVARIMSELEITPEGFITRVTEAGMLQHKALAAIILPLSCNPIPKINPVL